MCSTVTPTGQLVDMVQVLEVVGLVCTDFESVYDLAGRRFVVITNIAVLVLLLWGDLRTK